MRVRVSALRLWLLFALAHAAMLPALAETEVEIVPSDEPGDRVEIVNGSDQVCRTARAALVVDESAYYSETADKGLNWRGVWQDASVLIPDWSRAGGIEEAEFDFDNDGLIDRVTLFSYCCMYMKGVVALVTLGSTRSAPPPRVADAIEVVFTDPQYWFLPCQWDAQEPSIPRCPPFSQNSDEARLRVDASGDGEYIDFRSRYSRLTPVRIDQRTYVVVTGTDEVAKDYVAIIEPLPNKRFRSLCLLHVEPAID
jgi:hypothetical protein